MTWDHLVERTLALPQWAGTALMIWAARLVEPNFSLYMRERIYTHVVDEALRFAETLTVKGGGVPDAPLQLPGQIARLPEAAGESARATWEESLSPDTETGLASYAYAASEAALAAAYVLRTIEYSPKEFRPKNVRRTLDACRSSAEHNASCGWLGSYETVKAAEEKGRNQFIAQVERQLQLLEQASTQNKWTNFDGVPWEWFCGVNPFSSGVDQRFCKTFISYSHADATFAHRLYNALRHKGVECWLDEHNLRPGDRILDSVEVSIRRSQKLLLCCSRNSLQSWWVKDEIRKAQEEERRNGSNVIVPLLLDGFLLDEWSDGLAADIRSRLAADFVGWESNQSQFDAALARILEALRLRHEN